MINYSALNPLGFHILYSVIPYILTSFFLTIPSPGLANLFHSEHFTLKNGMEVIVINNNKVPAVSHMVWYKTGAIDEPVTKSGLAHFLEHLMFKGTAKFTNGEFSKMIAKAGGNDNAFTSHDYTAYFQNIAKEKLELVMQLESDRMQNLLFDEEEVQKERKVILEERQTRVENNPRALLKEHMAAALYRNHPYQKPIIGWQHEMKQLSLQDARGFYLTHYTPANAILVVSGDITAKELQPLAEKYYGSIKSIQPPKRVYGKEPPHKATIHMTLADEKVTQEEWLRYYLAPSLNTAKNKKTAYALTLLAHILGGSQTSILYNSLVTEQEIAAGISASYDDLTLGPTIFAIHSIPNANHSLATLEQAIEKHIQDIITHGISQEKLTHAKKLLIAETIYALEDLKTLAYIYGQALATGAGAEYVEQWQKNINAVSVRDLQEAAQHIFKPTRSVTGKLLPQSVPVNSSHPHP